MRTRVSEAILKWNLTKFTCKQRLVESNYEHKPHAQFLMTILLEIEPLYDTSYAVSVVPVMWLREALVVCE